MAEALDFDLRLDLPGFRLEATAEVPLAGVTALSGPSGSGKTTLLRVLAGLVPEARGHVRFRGRDWSGVPAHRRRIGFVFQEPRLFAHLTVARNLAYGARRRGAPDPGPLADRLGLGPLLARLPATLSGGEARRVALARALASAPDILFLDEPLAGLDGPRRDEVLGFVATTLAQAGLPALYVSHDPAEIAAVADRVLRIEDGTLQGWGDAPMRLCLRQVGAARGDLVLAAGGCRLVLPWSGPAGADGAAWALPLPPGRSLVAAAAPESPGAAVLPLEDVAPTGPGRIAATCGGQRIELPVGPGFRPAGDGRAVLLLAEARPLLLSPGP